MTWGEKPQTFLLFKKKKKAPGAMSGGPDPGCNAFWQTVTFSYSIHQVACGFRYAKHEHYTPTFIGCTRLYQLKTLQLHRNKVYLHIILEERVKKSTTCAAAVHCRLKCDLLHQNESFLPRFQNWACGSNGKRRKQTLKWYPRLSHTLHSFKYMGI